MVDLKMAFTTAKLTELPLRNTFPLASHSPSLNFIFSSSPKPPPYFSLLKTFSSLRTTERSSSSSSGRYNDSRNPKTNNGKKQAYPWRDDKNPRRAPNPSSQKSRNSSASWINKWSSSSPPVESKVIINSEGGEGKVESRYFDGDRGSSAIERIVLRLRNLGLGSDDENEDDDKGLEGENAMPILEEEEEEKLGDLLKRDWVRPDTMLVEEEEDEMVLPWERGEERIVKVEDDGKMKKRVVKAPSLAELTIEDTELRRLRRMGMTLRERINVAKAGVTQAVVEKIHDKWRKEELVRLKFHESLAHDMKTGHELVEIREVVYIL